LPDSQPAVLAQRLGFPEGPRWHDGRLWFSDQALRTIFTVDLEGRLKAVAEVPGHPSGLGWLPDGRLLVVSMTQRALLREQHAGKADLEEFARLDGVAPRDCNDMVVDESGRAYVGNFGFDHMAGEPLQPTALARVDADGTVSAAADGLVFPNGMVITPDGRSLIVAETFAGRITRFARAADGTLSNAREFARLDGIAPDGICLDADGAVWVASPTTGEAVRVAEGGKVLERIASGAPGAYACMLGGPERRTLFVCTATSIDWEEAARLREGQIVMVDVRVPGAGLP
jgi:sugar lactone lactonase YvrE